MDVYRYFAFILLCILLIAILLIFLLIIISFVSLSDKSNYFKVFLLYFLIFFPLYFCNEFLCLSTFISLLLSDIGSLICLKFNFSLLSIYLYSIII